MPIEFVARLELRECDAELEQRYEEYRRAKASLMAYLHNEDIKPSLAPKKETARCTIMTPLVKQEDQDFIARFLTIYKSLNEESQNLVLAFVRGMEFQREIERE